MVSVPPQGRRERKKLATRQGIAAAARLLFLERGFDAVSVKDIAEAADVSVTTLFKHFSSKEALFFDEDADREAELIEAVVGRAVEQSIPQALCAYFSRAYLGNPLQQGFLEFVRATPALEMHLRGMVMRYEHALRRTIAHEIGAPADDLGSATLARFALEAVNLARDHPDPQAALSDIFDLIEHGWTRK